MRHTQSYSEATDLLRIAAVPLSHLSIEVGHFYLTDIIDDIGRVESEFRRMVPLVTTFTESARVRFGPTARISTCYLLDDYFSPDRNAAEILDKLLNAASAAGLVIDYLVRESGCAQISHFNDGVPTGEPIPVAEMVAAQIVAEPAPQDKSRDRPTDRPGWLCNGRRSSEHDPMQAMRNRQYLPPEEFGRREHTIFLDVELWNIRTADGVETTRWSCAFLAAVWHLLRLGVLRYHGAPVIVAHPWHGEPWPQRWHDVPPLIQLNPDAEPFAAYRTLSMLPKLYIGVEHAVRLILDHLDLDEDVVTQIIASAAAEAAPVTISRKISDRLSHLLLDGA
ncbi:SCO2522 family protein [Nocardia bovistercoris]|uniref:Uncharacterized protein n=1 Tax=Nocardia bovistercoris TaxID=2785916 RepID=A0A931I6D7_9NOCA|nr:SCO2522 family protein [Nocardia bovistercoris]MBH0775709.1 hypothetical protein [Nocardia bovistercoris]